MVAQPFGSANEVLAQVTEGMDVYDTGGEKIGTVKQIYLGGEDLAEVVVSQDSVLYDVPEALRSRLAASGFIEIGTGLFQPNRYATGAQIGAINADGVHLATSKDDLARK